MPMLQHEQMSAMGRKRTLAKAAITRTPVKAAFGKAALLVGDIAPPQNKLPM